MKQFWARPLARYSLSQHIIAAALVVLLLASASWLVVRNKAAGVRTQERELRLLQTELAVLRESTPAAPTRFSSLLPEMSTADDVVRDVGRHAQSLGVQVRSLTVQPTSGTSAEHARIGFAIAANGSYPGLKSLLSELLGRFPTLSVQSLSLRQSSSAGSGVEMQATLMLWVRD